MSTEQKIKALRERLQKAQRKRDYVGMVKIQRELAETAHRTERVPMQEVATQMTVEDHYEAVCLMVRMFVFADLLYGAAVDFGAFLRRYGVVAVPLARMAEETARKCRSLTKEVDITGDEEFSDRFGQLCDECDLMMRNKVYAEEARLKEHIKQQHGKEAEK